MTQREVVLAYSIIPSETADSNTATRQMRLSTTKTAWPSSIAFLLGALRKYPDDCLCASHTRNGDTAKHPFSVLRSDPETGIRSQLGVKNQVLRFRILLNRELREKRKNASRHSRS